MTVVHHTNITTSKYRPLVRIVRYGKLSQVQCKFLTHVQRKDKTFHRFVSSPLLLSRTPTDRCVPTYYFTKFSLNESQSATLSIALLVELLDGEVVLTGPEDQLEGSNFGVKQSLDASHIAGNFTLQQSWRHACFHRTSRRHPVLPGSRFQVQIAGLLQQLANFLLHSCYLVFKYLRKLNIFSRIHLIQNGTQVIPIDLRITILSHILDKFHHLNTETISLDPHPEFGMLAFDPLDYAQEHRIHLVTQIVEVRRTQVRVVVDECLDLLPFDLRTTLVEQCAAVLTVEAGLADHARLAAQRICTHCEAWPTVDALRPLEFILSHCN